MTTSDFYYNSVWNNVIRKISETQRIADDVLDMYYKDCKLVTIEQNKAIVVVPAFINLTIMNQEKSFISSCISEEVSRDVEATIILKEEYDKLISPSVNKSSPIDAYIKRKIDPNYTFTNFVVGRSNAEAHLAAMTCANNPGVLYNPLFIYGNSGLGKTHLLNAIGNHFKTIFKDKTIAYMSGLEFVEAVSNSIKDHKIDEFKNCFKEVDILLVDDIQFIAGKEKTHEVFFSVFNELVNNKKQICITADRTPSEIKGLEDRIISRFNQGLNINIEAPEYETAINILKMKIANNISFTKDIDEDVLPYIATNFSQDVRSLEGAINRLLFYSISFSTDNRITLKLCMEAFKDQIRVNTNELSIKEIKKVVSEYYNLTTQQLIGSTRTKSIANARHIAMFLCRKLLDVPFKDIGREFGNKDHSTVITSCKKVEKLIASDANYVKAISEIESRLK